MVREIYDIGGMHCAACSSAVERVTRKLPGVERSEVNLPMNRLTISYDETQCSPADIIRKVERAGFTAAVHNEAPAEKQRTDDSHSGALPLVVSIVLAALLMVLSMGRMVLPDTLIPDIISPSTHPSNYALAQLLLCIPVLVLGRRFFVSGFRSVLHGNPNMDTLVALSASASVIFSIAMTFLIQDAPNSVNSLYYESAATVVALVSVGKYLEDKSKRRTKAAIDDLIRLAPDTAVLVDENGQWEVPVGMIKAGDTVLVKAGANVPLDGVVTSGTGAADESMLTGESMPVEKREGAELIGGSVCTDGALYMRVTRTGSDTTLARMIRFVEDAQSGKAPISRAADRVAGVFVPVVMGIALLAAVIWLLAGKEFSFALRIFTTVLVIACPCAMGLATPTAMIVGTGLGASRGILVRSGEALETAHSVTTVIFDKTGTITEGSPRVSDIVSADDVKTLETAYALEQLSGHPLSVAICEAARERELTAAAAQSFENISGRGLCGTDADGIRLLAGNDALMEDNNIDISEYAAQAQTLRTQGKTVVNVSRGNRIIGIIAISDPIKEGAAEAVSRLHSMNIKTVLLTGDNRAAAEYIGRQAGIGEIRAEVLPEQKAAVVRELRDKGERVMMVGDGINDAPALVEADTGCAIGSGSDIAIDSADIVLMNSRLEDVCRAIRLSRLTIRNIRQNLFWAFCYNTLGIPIAAGVLYPSLGLLLSPMIGGAAMSLSSLFVVTNALRLRGKKL